MKTTTSPFATSLLAAATMTLFATTASAADPLTGTYMAGDFTLNFDGGHFRGSQKNQVMVEGDYKVKGHQLEVTDRSGPWACPATQVGTYSMESKGKTLTLKKIADVCEGRIGSLTPKAWTKQS
ncbi:MAG TPA: hypothetical protein VGQ27_01585 [Steroidobacteraceae bacterium]|jgi:hypothetical protein|nr:hypothetical protein [Steroidobacteraceae bacterium]